MKFSVIYFPICGVVGRQVEVEEEEEEEENEEEEREELEKETFNALD